MTEELKFTIRLSKIKNYRVLDRVQVAIDVFYDPNIKVRKENIKKKCISIQKNPYSNFRTSKSYI